MKNQMINIKIIGLEIVFLTLCLLGLAQNNLEGIIHRNSNSDVKFELMGEDLVNGFTPSPANLNMLLEKGKDMHLKSVSLNPVRLDSIIEFSKNEMFMEKRIWLYHYDSNNLLKSSDRIFYNVYNEFMQVKETRNYNEFGQIISQVRTDRIYSGKDTVIDTYNEQNEYENGNLTKQQINEWDHFGIYQSTTINKYNEKHQIIQKIYNGSNGRYEQKRTTEYIYDPDDRIKYEVELTNWGNYAKKYAYTITDTLLTIQESSASISNYTSPAALDKIKIWNAGMKYLISMDEFGHTTSIVNSYYNSYYNVHMNNIKIEYAYNPTGKMIHASIYKTTIDDNFNSWVETTRIDNTYDEEDHIMEYKKTFYDARINEWAVEESKTYYYNSTKSAPIADNQNVKTTNSIYPNPAIDYIHFTVNPEPNSIYIIYNQMGQLMDKGIFTNQPIVISHLKRGAYFIKTENKGLPTVTCFFKK